MEKKKNNNEMRMHQGADASSIYTHGASPGPMQEFNSRTWNLRGQQATSSQPHLLLYVTELQCLCYDGSGLSAPARVKFQILHPSFSNLHQGER